jgi:hypothetical protein
MVTSTTHPNAHIMLMPTPHHIPPLDCVRRRGPTKNQTKTTINTTMAHTHPSWHHSEAMTPALANHTLPNPDFIHQQSSPPGLIYVVANTNDIPPSPPHLLLVLCHGLSSPTTLIKPYITAEMPNVESRQNPKAFWTKFPFDLHIHILTIITHLIIQICVYYYTPTTTLFQLSPPLSFITPSHFWFFLCEGIHRNAHSMFLIF